MFNISLFGIVKMSPTTPPKKTNYILIKKKKRKEKEARHWWLMPIIPATQEAEIRRITVQSQTPGNSSQDPISKKPFTRRG
jgi:hypothetical protein